MKPIIVDTKDFSVNKNTDIKISRITFEGLYNYKTTADNLRTVDALFYILDENQKLIPFYVLMSLDPDEDINDYSDLFFNKPIISNGLNYYCMIDVINKSKYSYFLYLIEYDDDKDVTRIKLRTTDLLVIDYILQCLYEHSSIDTKFLNDLYRVDKYKKYEIKKIGYKSFDDITIDRIHIDKVYKTLYCYFDWSFTNGNNKKEVIKILFKGDLDKDQCKKAYKKFIKSDKYIKSFDDFKEYGIALENNQSVYAMMEPIRINYRTLNGSILYRVFFVNHYYLNIMSFLAVEFENFIGDFIKYIAE